MNCPVCKKTMIILEFDQVEVDYCPSCQGVWLDQGELELLLQNHERALDLSDIPGSKKGERRCPRCTKKMRKGNFPGTQVEVDICPRDNGLWLDKGELAQIAEARASQEAVQHVKNFFSGLFKE
ncbi:MAG: zf-TFIIB domain-containing protein [Calditrichia bacterium]